VVAGRQTPYKRIDLAVAACTKLSLPLSVIGNGPDHGRLVALAGPTIRFLTDVKDSAMPAQFQAASAFIFPGVDDFGIVAVEALAAGAPVVAYQAGGALDYVVPPKTGAFFTAQTVDSLAETLSRVSKMSFDNAAVSRSAEPFNPAAFRSNLTKQLEQLLG
jgi:glycosyltransferase involved in cell wall biosynthesis